MTLPIQISWRNLKSSAAIESEVRKKAEKLNEFYSHIMSCRIVIEAPHGHHHKGNLYHIRIDLTVPGGEIVAKRDPPKHSAHEDIYVAVRDAFDAARRQLQDYARRQRGDVKKHAQYE